jgi:hypothetical protein
VTNPHKSDEHETGRKKSLMRGSIKTRTTDVTQKISETWKEAGAQDVLEERWREWLCLLYDLHNVQNV